MRKFLWSTNLERLESNLVRLEGGLGLRRVKEFNEPCLLKLAWSASSTNSLWANWFRERYFEGTPFGIQETKGVVPVFGRALDLSHPLSKGIASG